MRGLYVDSVVKSYGDRVILSDVCISCEPGEILGLAGLNGSGKSTLLKIIASSLDAGYRFVRVDGKQVEGISDGYKMIKYLPQDNFLPGNLKLKTALRLYCDQAGCDYVLNHPVIAPYMKRRCRNLSTGERRFFEILLLICSDAPYILLDEPFNGLSPLLCEEIVRLLKLKSEEKGFIITDHSWRNILDVATRMVIIHDGVLRRIDRREDLRYWGYMGG